MNRPETYNKAVIPNPSVSTDELSINSTLAIAYLQTNDNQAVLINAHTIAKLKEGKTMREAS